MSDRSPGLSQVLRSVAMRHLEQVRIGIPAKVELYDPTTRTASVQPLILDRVENEEGGWDVERLPVIQGVPVDFLCGGGFEVTVPLVPGDTGYLMFSDASLDTWMSEGGEVDPGEPRSFGINDAVFKPGIVSAKHAKPASTKAVRVGKIGEPGQPMVLGGTLKDFLDELRDALAEHTHESHGASTSLPIPDVPDDLLSDSAEVTA